MSCDTCLWLVIPCYNEAGEGNRCLELMAPLFVEKLESLVENHRVSESSKICFVDDGSSDDTWTTIERLSEVYPWVVGLRLSRNRGHQNALLAGLMEARVWCDVSVSMDCDGQDDMNAIDAMLRDYERGYDVVYGVRSSRAKDTAFKRTTAEGFYRLMRALGADVVFNHADYRLMSKRALDGLAEFDEVNLFLRGIVPLVGYPSSVVMYERSERASGKTHYPLRKMIALAIDGITSLSVKPIRLVAALGIVMSLLGVSGVVWAVATAIAGHSVAGWASTMSAIGLVGGIQLFCLGVIGEYVGKIYLEVKRRPRYIISQRAGIMGNMRVSDIRDEP